VDQEQRLVLLLELDEAGQRRDVAVHAVDALDRDEHPAVVGPQLGELLLQRFEVVVRERPPLGPGQPGAARMQSCASESCRMRSCGPSRCPITVTKIPWPETVTIASSQPRKRASSCSSSRWSGFSPLATRLAETLVPYRSTASCAARVTWGSPERPR